MLDAAVDKCSERLHQTDRRAQAVAVPDFFESMAMAKPRIFVSSTYYDLKYIRAGLEAFINSMGYDSILFENGDIPFQFDQSLEDSCYKEVENADMFILVIGGRYGSLTKEENDKIKEKPELFYERLKSVTAKEYGKALERDLPTFIFVDAAVLAELSTFKANKVNKTINYAHVDSTLIFDLIEIIMAQKRNNFVRGFSTIEDITDWLRDQWAGLFTDYLRRNVANKQLTSLQQQVQSLSEVAETLKRYNEAIIKTLGTADSKKIIDEEALIQRNIKATRFATESFVEYLMMSSDNTEQKKDMEILDLFNESIDAIQFMEKIAIPEVRRDGMMSEFKEEINRDFVRLKQKYASDKSRITPIKPKKK